MKKSFVTFLISIATIIFSFGLHTAHASDKSVSKTVKTNIYCDHCKQCASCGQRLYDGIKDIEGVKQVKINPEENEIVIKYNDAKTDMDEIELAITKLGFDANDKTADPEAYDLLDGCCKKN